MTLTDILASENKSLTNITDIYHGKDNYCRCGCGGKYFAPKSKGYTRALNALAEMQFEKKRIEIGDTYINLSIGDESDNKCYCLYFQ